MDEARARVTAAVAGKADTRKRVETDEEGAYVVEDLGLAAVLAGDVVALAALVAKPDPIAAALGKGAGKVAAVNPDQIVFQRADQLRHLLSLLPAEKAAEPAAEEADGDDTDLEPADPAAGA